ncbi:hypothetical protein JCM9533A_51840 [Catenuloplanes niger JCM 9533]
MGYPAPRETLHHTEPTIAELGPPTQNRAQREIQQDPKGRAAAHDRRRDRDGPAKHEPRMRNSERATLNAKPRTADGTPPRTRGSDTPARRPGPGDPA